MSGGNPAPVRLLIPKERVLSVFSSSQNQALPQVTPWRRGILKEMPRVGSELPEVLREMKKDQAIFARFMDGWKSIERLKFIKEYLKPILVALLLALFIRAFIVQAFKIPSGSMEPTLLVGDHLLVNKFIYGIRIPYVDTRLFPYEEPTRGDVIVFIYPVDPSKDFIKRVIATGGEKVQIIDQKIFINDKQIPDPWGYFKERRPRWFQQRIENYGPVVVPPHSLFVMGDNRDNSEDSRFWGFVPLDNVLGKALVIYFSWDRQAENLWGEVRWSRIGEFIH
jgi:signal peptidase I